MGILVRDGLFRSTGVLALAVAVVLGVARNPEPASATTNITVGPGVVVLPLGARTQLGFQFGPVDGVMGGVKESPNHYRFFGSGESLNTKACPGTPGVQGVYAFTADLSVSPPSFTTNCTALLQPSGPLVETGIDGPFDRNYVGGGPTMRVTHPDGRRGVLLVYHAEIQWYDDGPCASGTTLCFYGTLGMAFSSDDGVTFQKLGLIIQSHISRATFHTPPYLGGNVPIGNGPFVLGDASGNAVDPRTADPTQTYIYVFYVDNQEDLGSSDPCAPSKACLAVARAPLSQVIQAAFAGDGITLSGLFQKYYNGGFGQPAAPPDPNGTLPTNNAGPYTPLLKGAFSPSAVYHATTGQVILASVTAGQIQLRVSQNLLDWSEPPVATLSEAAPFAEVRYPSLIGELEDADVAGGQPWLFYSREPPNGTWPQTEFMVARLQVSGPHLSPFVSLNQTTFAVGQTLNVKAGLTNPGLSGNVDVYAGLLGPNNSIQFITSTGIVAGNVTNLASFRPLATSVPLATPFSVTAPNFYSHQWTGSEPRGTWVFFVGVVTAGAVAGGTIPDDSILGLASASFSFP
jgi:hypothetical protein